MFTNGSTAMDGFSGSEIGSAATAAPDFGWLLLNRCDEPDAFARQRSDESLLVTAIADGGPYGVDAACERRFRNDAASPDGRDQIIPTNNAVTVLNEKPKQIKDLRLNGDQAAIALQFAPIGIEFVFVE
jgi:hypothetical protein